MFGLIEIMWDVSVDIACYRDVVLFSKQSTLTFITKTVLEVVSVLYLIPFLTDCILIELILSYYYRTIKKIRSIASVN